MFRGPTIVRRQPSRSPLSLAIGLAALMSLPAAGSVLEEVVVTAQKREQSQQDVGIAITSFTGDQLSKLGVEESFDIATVTPGVHISGNLAGQNVQFSIRGVTQNDFNDIIEAPNAVYLDEGYLAIAQAQTFAVFDIERVEILKGPQGTLFGRNATGGLAHYVSNKPSLDEHDGYVDVSYGEFDTDADANKLTIEAAYGGPLTENTAARLAVKYNRQDPYLKNRYPESAFGGESVGLSEDNAPGEGAGADLGDDDTLAGRLSFLFQPSEDIEVLVSANYAHSEVSTGPYQSKSTIAVFNDLPGNGGEVINVIDTPSGETRESIVQGTTLDAGSDQGDSGTFTNVAPRPVAGGDFFGYLDPDGDDFSFSSDFAFDDHGEVETWGLNAKVTWDLNDTTTLTSITDYKSYEKLLFIDVDSAPVNQLANYAATDSTSFTQELRISGESESTRWVAGLFYLNIDNDSDNGLKAPINSLPLVFGAFPPHYTDGGDISVDAELETNSYSVFGQVEWDLNEQLTLIAGARLTREDKDYEMAQGLYASNSSYRIHQGERITLNSLETDSSDTFWTGKLQLDYRLENDILLYAGINRGVKAGSFNAPLAGTFFSLPGGNADIPYEEEVLTSYEAGFKSTWFEGTTRLNGSVFYYDYKDYQSFLFTGVGGVVINNDATNLGVELELQTSPAEGWDALFSVAWFDAEVQDVPLSVNSSITRDVKPTYAPELQVTALVRYQWDAFGGTMAIQGDVAYSDEFYYNLRNFDADKFDSYVIGNARLSWSSPNELWETSLALRNISDERAGVQGFDLATLCGCNEVSYRAPRSIAVGIRRNF
jgi:iron complex outermembrane receptor protein